MPGIQIIFQTYLLGLALECLGTADDFNKKSAEQLASERAMAAMGILNGNGSVPSLPAHEEEEEEQD